MIWIILKICFYLMSCFLCIEYFKNKKEIYELQLKIADRDRIIEMADKDQAKLVRQLNRATGHKEDPGAKE